MDTETFVDKIVTNMWADHGYDTSTAADLVGFKLQKKQL